MTTECTSPPPASGGKALFAPSPADLASQAFFALLAVIALATVSNGFLYCAGVSGSSLAQAAATTTTLLF